MTDRNIPDFAAMDAEEIAGHMAQVMDDLDAGKITSKEARMKIKAAEAALNVLKKDLRDMRKVAKAK